MGRVAGVLDDPPSARTVTAGYCGMQIVVGPVKQAAQSRCRL